jgi:hypothetical protein
MASAPTLPLSSRKKSSPVRRVSSPSKSPFTFSMICARRALSLSCTDPEPVSVSGASFEASPPPSLSLLALALQAMVCQLHLGQVDSLALAAELQEG